MKKILSLLFLSSSLFSMQLALKMQIPRFDRVKSAVVKQQKAIVLQTNQIVSKVVDTPKVYINASSVRTPYNLSDIKLYHGKKGFVVLHDNKKHVIEKCFMDQTARSITREGLRSFLKTGRFEVKQFTDGTFMLNAHHRLTGGGPIFGGFMYWVTKSLCYGTAAAAVGGTIVATGGAAAGALGIGSTAAATGAVATSTASTVAAGKVTGLIIAKAVSTTATASIVSTVGTVTAGPLAAGAMASGVGTVAVAVGAADALGVTVAGVAAGKAAAMTTAVGISVAANSGAAATVGTGAAIVMGIETLSVAVGSFFGMLPTP